MVHRKTVLTHVFMHNTGDEEEDKRKPKHWHEIQCKRFHSLGLYTYRLQTDRQLCIYILWDENTLYIQICKIYDYNILSLHGTSCTKITKQETLTLAMGTTPIRCTQQQQLILSSQHWRRRTLVPEVNHWIYNSYSTTNQNISHLTSGGVLRRTPS